MLHDVFAMGDCTYYVETPCSGTFYFKSKTEANKFINFYSEYTNKQNYKDIAKKLNKNVTKVT